MGDKTYQFDNHKSTIVAQGSVNNSTLTQNVHVQNIIASFEAENERQPRYYVEESCVPNFVGREDVLSAVEAHLIPGSKCEHKIDQNRKVFVIQGIGGTGKTQISLKFAETHRTRFWAVAMIDARSYASINQSFQEIGRRANILSIADNDKTAQKIVKNWLANLSADRHWLLVFDGANNPEIDLRDCFPSGGRGAILITTICPTLLPVTDNDQRSLSKQQSIHGLDLKNATTLLVQTSQETASESCLVKAKKICERLEALPLAIIHAGTMIRNGHWTFNNFLNDFGEYQRGLFSTATGKDATAGYQWLYGTTIACRDMIQARSQEEKAPEAADALDILMACSLLDHRSIPLEVFERLPRRSQQKRGLLGGLSSVFAAITDSNSLPKWERSRLRTAVIMLANYSLATYNRTTQEFSIHRSVHQWICLDLKYISGAHSRRWATSAVSFGLSTMINSDFRDQKHHATRSMLVPHLTAFLEQDVAIFAISNMNDEEMAEKYAFLYFETGHYDLAERWYRNCMSFCERLQKRGISRYLKALTCLSQVLERKGDFVEASQLSQKAKDGWMKLDPTSSSAIRSRQALALSFKGLGKITAAKEELLDLLEIPVPASELMAESSLETTAILVDVLRREGDITGAIERSEQNFENRKRLLGFEHQDTLESARSLAMALLQHGGRLSYANGIMERVCRSREKNLGPNHPDTILSLSSLAKLLKKQGKYKEAEEEQTKALNRLISVVGPGHPDALSMMTSLGDLCLQKNHVSEAEGLFRTAYHGYMENGNFGPRHSHTLTAQMNVALVLQIRGQLDDANEVYTEMMEIFKANGTERSPDALHCMTNQSDLCAMRGKYAEAEALALKVAGEYRILHGDKSMAYYSALLLASRAILSQEKYDEAERLSRIARNGFADVCGPRSPKALDALAMLGLSILYQDRNEESLAMFREASDGFKILGDHQHWCHEEVRDS